MWIFFAVALAACGPAKNKSDPVIPGTYTYNFTLSSNASNLPITRKVVYVSSPADIGCLDIVGPFNHDFVGTVADGTQSILINPPPIFRSTYYWESIYIDVNGNSVLDNPDLVWGPSGTSIFGFCTRPNGNTSVTALVVWEDTGTNFFGGWTTFTGTNVPAGL
jgi:hypothetical protein